MAAVLEQSLRRQSRSDRQQSTTTSCNQPTLHATSRRHQERHPNRPTASVALRRPTRQTLTYLAWHHNSQHRRKHGPEEERRRPTTSCLQQGLSVRTAAGGAARDSLECLLVPENLHIGLQCGHSKAFTADNIRGYRGRTTDTPFLPKNGTAILRVSRLLYNEALSILYGRNTFNFTTSGIVGCFFDTIAPKSLSLTGKRQLGINPGVEHIKHVIMAGVCRRDTPHAMQRFRNIEGLKSLTIYIYDGDVQKRSKWDWDNKKHTVGRILNFIDESAPESERQARLDKISFVCVGKPWQKSTQHPLSSDETPSRFKAKLREFAGLD